MIMREGKIGRDEKLKIEALQGSRNLPAWGSWSAGARDLPAPSCLSTMAPNISPLLPELLKKDSGICQCYHALPYNQFQTKNIET